MEEGREVEEGSGCPSLPEGVMERGRVCNSCWVEGIREGMGSVPLEFARWGRLSGVIGINARRFNEKGEGRGERREGRERRGRGGERRGSM